MLISELLIASQGLDQKRQVVWRQQGEEYQPLTGITASKEGFFLYYEKNESNLDLGALQVLLSKLEHDGRIFLPDKRPVLGYQIFQPTIICLN